MEACARPVVDFRGARASGGPRTSLRRAHVAHDRGGFSGAHEIRPGRRRCSWRVFPRISRRKSRAFYAHAPLALLTGLPASAGARTGVHSELGMVTLAHMLNEWASHDLGHLRQIAELYRAREFHPHSGPFIKYLNLKP